ncbi:hypothetical protein [Halobacterium wangiae]|uniref:hypothetical protein n=1 Tax=Halobacterium wangiae TaxID=2902623 RepID=UPI001E50B985|nr:hypothetical protein [Halobacterium wangiae]
MSSLAGRFRSWLGSVEFAVTATAVVVGLAAMVLAFEMGGDSTDGYFVLLLAGVAAPSIYETQWPRAYERRAAGVAWALVASLALVACYALVVTGLRVFVDGLVPSAAAFVVAWLLGIAAARSVGGDPA